MPIVDYANPLARAQRPDYSSYLATKKISALVEATSVEPVGQERRWIGHMHRRTDVALGYGLRPREAAVVRGMVLGDRSLMPEELEKAFQRSGITHVLAISGQHIAILAAVIYFAIRRVVWCRSSPTFASLCSIHRRLAEFE